MIVYTEQGRAVELGETIGHGGEAAVYRLDGQPGWLAKIYEPEPRPNYLAKLSWMIDHPPENPTGSLNHPSLAWPEGLFYDGKGRLKGYRMPYIDYALALLEVFNPRRRAEALPQFDRRYLHRTARNLAAALSALHHSGYVAGDVNESNVLVTPQALVTLIDTDSFQVREERSKTVVLYPCPVGKPEYTPPELQGKILGEVAREPTHDAFGLAALIFQLLMDGSHPFRAQWLGPGDPPPMEKRIVQGAYPYVEAPDRLVAPPRNALPLDTLHPALVELFRRCFVDGHTSPRRRPGPDLWVRVIREAEACLVCCAEGHFYSAHLAACPYCAGAAKRPATGARPAPVLQNAPAGAPFPGRPVAMATPVGSGSRRSGSMGVLGSRPWLRPAALRGWILLWLRLSVLVGGGRGALAGAGLAALVALLNWSAGSPLNWDLLAATAGAAGGLLRGWQPGARFAHLVGQYLGWKRFWQGMGLIVGAAVAGAFGMAFVWTILPSIFAVILGAQGGLYLGGRFWQAGQNLSWERILAVVGALGAAGVGWVVAEIAGTGGLDQLGAQLGDSLLLLSGDGQPGSALIWLLAGGLSGAVFGALAGVLVDLFGRLVRLTK